MNHHEAKFILRARRPDGQDARDPVFAEALAAADNDPKLKAWLENEATFDRAVSSKLEKIQPPAGLKEAILAGARLSQQRQRVWWKNPAWIGIAAAIAITTVVVVRSGPSRPSAQDFSEYALNELATTHDGYTGHRAVPTELQSRLSDPSLPLPGNIKLDADELRRLGCRTVSFAGHEAFEICFERNGHWYHLYASSVQNFSRGAANARSLLKTEGQFTTTAWKDGQFAYALVTADGPDALKKLI